MNRLVMSALLATALAACSPAPSSETLAADNTGKNVRDRSASAMTATSQSNNEADVATTKTIREAVVADKTLSVNAQNIKIITADGVVTLRGPVGSVAEKASIGATAQRVAVGKHVQNELEIASN